MKTIVPRLFPFPHTDPGNLVELEYVAGHDLFQRSARPGLELAGCSAPYFRNKRK